MIRRFFGELPPLVGCSEQDTLVIDVVRCSCHGVAVKSPLKAFLL